uniref:Ionotropic receptor 8a n=1 Tax=Adelphocoris lineolatus TaxID=236346 RepID=A0A2I4PGY3_ADELI|nr:ionotropic receptor 8a [Adelphocoris lineolatus]
MRTCLWFHVVLFVAHEVAGQGVKLLVVKDNNAGIWDSVSTSFFEQLPVTVDKEDTNSTINDLCEVLKEGVWGVLDLTWSGLDEIKAVCNTWGLPYVRLEYGITQYLRGADKSLATIRKAPDAALIFQTEEQLDQSLFYLIRESSMRVILFKGLSDKEAETLTTMRPTPNFNIIFADTPSMNVMFLKAVERNLVRYDDRWILVFLDNEHNSFDRKTLVKRVTLATPTIDANAAANFAENVAETLEEVAKTSGIDLSPVPAQCEGSSTAAKDLTVFQEKLSEIVEKKPWLDWRQQESTMALHLDMDWTAESSKGEKLFIGSWNSKKGLTIAGNVTKIPRFFRVATGYMVPFAYPVIDPSTGAPKLDDKGNEVWEGYCIDLINRLAEDMDFDYELTTSYNFGRKLPNGSWDGLIGDLASGRVDIIVAALTMTSEREEVIDFVAPYFEQTGFSIVIRKPLRKTSLFKFMTVLRVEVWFSILAALCLTAFMIWFLDKYSPYSARNNKDKYPYPTREFTLRESFWFAVTSFTPQGGGEAPKSLSARTLVAAYWLFVVLMLATFTANLAAFLTVERMQSPVQSLKQLARQSRINYTVVQDSDAHSYFRNMKFAEETLYRVWKEITLNASANQSQYRVWDYPIKEQYGHILISMEKTGTVNSTEEGFQKVRENEDAEFALIHDALEIKYEVYRDCNLTEIGEPFAEQPYSIAVQQGSHLNEEISRRILDLQKDRYFESLSGKYWNSTMKGKCDSSDEDEGITLESLGGVFIATLFGLVLAMLTLGIEIVYERKAKKNVIKVKSAKPEKSEKSEKKEKMMNNPFFNDDKLFSREFGSFPKKPSKLLAPKPKVSFITVFPRDQLY